MLIYNLIFNFSIIFLRCCHCRKISCSTFKNKLNNSSQIIHVKNSKGLDNVIMKSFMLQINNNMVYGRSVFINNANDVIEILQADNDNEGCSKGLRSLPSKTALKSDNCEFVVNAGLFDTNSNECYGNVINNGNIYINSGGIMNAHFGIRKDGKLFFGYLSEEEVLDGSLKSLVGGAIWLVRNSQSVVEKSIQEECDQVQETGSLSYFANVISARSAIGAMVNGTVVIVQISGRTAESGVNLFQLADIMISMGVVVAINLDGGGSSTAVINRTLVSLPSDKCGVLFTCEREVTTVLCVRAHCPSEYSKQYSCIHGFLEGVSLTFYNKYLLIALIICLLIFIIYVIQYLLRIWRNRLKIKIVDKDQNIVDQEPLIKEDFDL